MAFTGFPDQQQGVHLLQRSLTRGRLGHAYLFTGHTLEPLEGLAATLAKTLNCHNPVRQNGAAIDCCDQCAACRKIDHGNHADVHWVRPESKLRQIKIEQITRRDNSPPRVMLEFVAMKPTEGRVKVGIVVAADRMNEAAANAFLKTLEEPPADSIFILLTTEPQRLLETILSRCLRLNFGGESLRQLPPAQLEWLTSFSALAAAQQKSLIGRYCLLDVLLKKLNETKSAIDENLTARSPIEQNQEAEQNLVDKWETELAAAIEAEYRRQRSDLLALLQAWLRDVWVQAAVYGPESTTGKSPKSKVQSPKIEAHRPEASVHSPELTVEGGSKSQVPLLNFPQLEGTRQVATRISPEQARENLDAIDQLQRWLYTNVQEALALEVGLLKLRL